MKNQKGFIQIPLLIAIIAGVLVISGASYFGIKNIKIIKSNITVSTTTTPTTANNSPPKVPKPSVSSTRLIQLSNHQIIQKVKPAVVYIETDSTAGSGMIITSDGYILTNAHVVKGYTNAQVSLVDNSVLSGVVAGRDENADLALIKVNAANLTTVDFGDSDKVQQGDDVFTLGFPFGIKGDVDFKNGTISRMLQDGNAQYLETSAEIHPGNSGGPLVDRYGQVVGVNTATFGNSIQGVSVGETIKLAIPINVAKNLIPELKGGRTVLLPVDTKQAEYQAFTEFKKEYLAILSDAVSAINLMGDAESQSMNGNYFTAISKIKDSNDILNNAIAKLQVIHIPSLPFSQTINELVALQIEDYKWKLLLNKASQDAYEALLNPPYSNLDPVGKLTNIEYVNQILDRRKNTIEIPYDNWTSTEFVPKQTEFNEKVDAYFK